MKTLLRLLLVVAIVSAWASIASAETVHAKVHVEADENGVVTISGEDAGQFTTAIQYCTGKYASGCDPNVVVKIIGGSFAMDKDGLKYHQNAFNLKVGKKWLRIPDEDNVTTGKNIEIQSGGGGSTFVYTGPIPKK